MAENLYPITIPEYTDSADIRKAFYRYHYGTDDAVTTPSEIQPNSIAKYLDDTIKALNSAQDRLGSISLLGTSVNLNDLVTAAQVGIYQSIDTPTLALNYPVAGIRGLLSVVLSENSPGSVAQNTVYQTYQTQSTSTENNDFYWRSGIFNPSTNSYQWTSWAEASKQGHTHSEYVENNTLNSKVDTTIGPNNTLSASRGIVTDANGKIIPSATVSAADVSTLGGIFTNVATAGKSMITLLGEKSNTSHVHDDRYYAKQSFRTTANVQHSARVFVQSTEPSVSDADTSKRPAVDDLWFW